MCVTVYANFVLNQDPCPRSGWPAAKRPAGCSQFLEVILESILGAILGAIFGAILGVILGAILGHVDCSRYRDQLS